MGMATLCVDVVVIEVGREPGLLDRAQESGLPLSYGRARWRILLKAGKGSSRFFGILTDFGVKQPTVGTRRANSADGPQAYRVHCRQASWIWAQYWDRSWPGL